MRFLPAFAVAMLVGACGGGAKPVPAPPVQPARPAASQVVPLAGGANALWWDAASATLYLTDSNAASLVAWTDKGGLARVATVPAGTAGVSLGGLVRRADGSTVVANFGFGKQGGLFVIAPDKTVTALSGLDPQRRRVGLAESGGTIYSAYFVGDRDKKPTGGVATVAITGPAAVETELAGESTSAGFGKIVGVAASATTVYVSDQSQKAIFAINVADHAVRKLADVPGADLLVLLPDGDLLTGSGATISRITPAGQVSPLATTTFEQVRGLAYDAAGKRLFVIEHSLTPGSPDKLHIVPL